MTFTHRLATEADLDALRELMELAIAEHLKDFLDPDQVRVSRSIMGLDTQLVADRTYFIVEDPETGRMAGCGGWSKRATLYGGDHSTDQRSVSEEAPCLAAVASRRNGFRDQRTSGEPSMTRVRCWILSCRSAAAQLMRCGCCAG
jgi:hypothetical protein